MQPIDEAVHNEVPDNLPSRNQLMSDTMAVPCGSRVTKFPLCAVLMELSAQLAHAGRRLVRRWYPRLQNTEADDLSNGICHQFDPGLRVNLDLRPEAFRVLPDLVRYGEELYGSIEASKAARGAEVEQPAKRPKGDRLKERDPW